MKISTNKTLDNGVCRARVATGDFSELDWSLMRDFGEPTINLGGVFSTGTPAQATGTVDLSGGYDFSTSQPTFGITVNGGTPVQVTLNEACADLPAIVLHIGNQLAAAGLGTLMLVGSVGVHAALITRAAGASQTFTLAAGSVNDALAILGMAVDTYSGTGPDDFILPNRLARVKSDSPFITGFDSRDTSQAVAAYRGETWAAQTLAKIEAAMDTLRANADDYTDESMITY